MRMRGTMTGLAVATMLMLAAGCATPRSASPDAAASPTIKPAVPSAPQKATGPTNFGGRRTPEDEARQQIQAR